MTWHIVGAGAGSGKTTRIMRDLTAWVVAGEVRPERILAVSFTDAAASELKGRIRGALLDAGRLEDAAALERAYISTIHALGSRILTENAFAAGVSPGLRLIEEAEAQLLLRRALAETTTLDGITRDLEAAGYRHGWESPVIDQFRKDLGQALKKLDELGDRGDDPDLPARAAAALRADWPETAADGAEFDAALRRTIASLVDVFPDGIVDCATSKSARESFEADRAALLRGTREASYTDWTWWQKLRDLRLTKRGCPTPEGYDDLARAVMDAADALPRHPGPRDQAAARLELMLRGAQEVRRRYAADKTRLGVTDFGDMISRAEALLREHPEVVATMMAGIDCVVVDEFQDTNPVQFSLLARLIGAAPRVLLVGDTKQAIMGFQGSDARLSQALTEARREAAQSLESNWRSVPGIMAFANDLGPELFDDYTALTAQRPAIPGTPLEALRIGSNKKETAKGPAHVAARIAALLSEGRQIEDRQTKRLRPLRPSDIAILVRRNKRMDDYAAPLAELGIPVDQDEDGWIGSPAITVARAALAVIADPGDSFAALIWLTHGPARLSLEDGLRIALDGGLGDHAALAPLAALAEAARGWTVARVVAGLRTTGGLADWAATLDDPDRAHADLVRLDAEAASFDGADPATRAAAGIHGWDLRSFLSWLALRVEADENRRPDPGTDGARGVRLTSWHKAKGLEWPVVVVTGLETELGEWVNTLRIEFDGWDDPAGLLDRATIHFHPAVAADEVRTHFATARRAPSLRTERALAYVAITRARDLLILEWPDWVPEDKDVLAHLLRDEAGLSVEADALVVNGKRHPATVTTCGEAFPEVFAEAAGTPAPTVHLRPGRPEPVGPRGLPLHLRPSDGGESGGLWAMETVELGPALPGDGHTDAAERGTALHVALRALLQRPDLADRIGPATGLPQATLESLRAQADGLRSKLAALGLTDLRPELPLDVEMPTGQRVRGTTDLLALSPDGRRGALVDFKSPAPDTPLEAVRPYLAQVEAYTAALAAQLPGTRIERAGIHFLGSGTLVWGAPG